LLGSSFTVRREKHWECKIMRKTPSATAVAPAEARFALSPEATSPSESSWRRGGRVLGHGRASVAMQKTLAHWQAVVIPIILRYRRPLAVTVQTVLIGLSYYLAFWLRFDGFIPKQMVTILVRTLPWLIAIRSLIFVPFGLYQGLWCYAGIWD